MQSQFLRRLTTPSYTELLEGRTPAGYDARVVDLSFGLRSGSESDVTHTIVVNLATSVILAKSTMRASKGADIRAGCSQKVGGERDFISPVRAVGGNAAGAGGSTTKTAGVGVSRLVTHNAAIDGWGEADDWSATEVMGQQFWNGQRQQMQQPSTSGIMKWVANMHVGGDDTYVDCDAGGAEDVVWTRLVLMAAKTTRRNWTFDQWEGREADDGPGKRTTNCEQGGKARRL
ncbi:hypothetical protein CBR_g34461 [Chara braunii]|uniref:Uncharacterized protein n=1 Tax=Chara braunii TaxID=69332 RepID=A0A388LIN1_CHABU|nr:hypothetical protein CBR_g34461 [Chara braunii]|eukprot:GBG82179.1 hypothetical protein CBR_g34461 [Chara braunii]